MIKLAPVNKHPEFKDSFLTQLQVNYFDEYHPQCGQVYKISDSYSTNVLFTKQNSAKYNGTTKRLLTSHFSIP